MTICGEFEGFQRLNGGGWAAIGWAYDNSSPDDAVRLILTYERGSLGEFSANIFRPALVSRGIGNGEHAFAVKVPNILVDGRPHFINILPANGSEALPCVGDQIFFPSRFRGCIDYIKCGALYGWALDDRELSRPVVVDIFIDGNRHTTLTCDMIRDDLASLLGTDGEYGFCFPMPALLFDGEAHKIKVLYTNTEIALDKGEITLVRSPRLLTMSRLKLEQKIARNAAASKDDQSILAIEPVQRLDDASRYHQWLTTHETMISNKFFTADSNSTLPIMDVFRLTAEMDASALATAVAASHAEVITFLEPGACLHPLFAAAIRRRFSNGSVDIVYTDEDIQTKHGNRHSPHFKPEFDQDRYFAFPYVGFSCAVARTAVLKAAALISTKHKPRTALGWAEAILDIALLTASPDRIAREPYVLYHQHEQRPIKGLTQERAGRVQDFLNSKGYKARASLDAQGLVRVYWSLPNITSKITLIIPTRDRVDLLRVCIDSVITKTKGVDYRIIIIDNNSEELRTAQYFRQVSKHPKIKICPYPGEFNYAAMHNSIVKELTTPYIGLLNNDVEVINEDWLTEMLSQAARTDVGAVGAKLLYPDDMIQHGGVLVGMNDHADHMQRVYTACDDGYFNSAIVAQTVSAVTAACLVMRRDDYVAVGGMDANNLAVCFNDVDLCLKLRAIGRRIIWTPHARLYHYESATRGTDKSKRARDRAQKELDFLRKKWSTDSYEDPFYSPNLAKDRQSHVDFSGINDD